MMKGERGLSFWWKAATIASLAGMVIALLGWEPGPSPHEVYVCVVPYEKFQDYEHHLVPYHAGMTIRDAVNAAIKKRGLPSLNESELEPIIDRHLVWTWRGSCHQLLDALASLLKGVGLENSGTNVQVWGIEHGFDNPHVLRVDGEHSQWNSKAQPSDFIRVFARDAAAK